jgi:hypothetical protein
MVTDPSGGVLLSTDGVTDRQFRVQGGVVVQNLGTHATGSGKCGGISIQLMPFDDTPNPGGEYKAWVTPVANYNEVCANAFYGFCPGHTKTDNFKVRESLPPGSVSITGYKFYDANTNGVKDGSEPYIPGWKIEKVPPTPSDVTYTGASGWYGFLVLPNTGLYTIFEDMPNSFWLPTTPTSGQVTVGSVDVAGPNFGNVCLGPGGGLTLGYWSNKNGQKLVSASDLSYLSSLFLRNGDGTDFNPASASSLSVWLLNGTAVNMENMLSVQLTAMVLNVRHSFVSGGAIIFAPGTNSASVLGFATVNAVINEAITEIGTHPTAWSGDAWRSHAEALKNALDKANNNLNFVQAQPCAFTSPY